MSSFGDPDADLSADWLAPRDSSAAPGVCQSHSLFSINLHRCVYFFRGYEESPSFPQRYGGWMAPLQLCPSETMFCVGVASSRALDLKRLPTVSSTDGDLKRAIIRRSLNYCFDGD